MTQNQIAYWSLQEQIRSAKERERETARSNRVTEEETHRSNLARETEAARNNAETHAIARANLLELGRHQAATEAIARNQLALDAAKHAENVRSNLSNESLKAQQNYAQRMLNNQNYYVSTSNLAEQSRANRAREELSLLTLANQRRQTQWSYLLGAELNAIRASELDETKRSNLARESETYRANVARETQTRINNLATLEEQKRSNIANEAIQLLKTGVDAYGTLNKVLTGGNRSGRIKIK